MFRQNNNRISFSVFAVTVALLAALLLAGSVFAVQQVRVDNEGETPFYARFGTNETFSDGDRTVIIFYRPPGCIPADFNMMDFFDLPDESGPGAFGCQPTTTDGYEMWEGEPGSGPAPLRVWLRGRGAVPVWFVNTAELQALIDDDGVVTITDLESLSPLKGIAGKYYEVLHPSQSNEKPLIIFRAEGELQGGGSFWARASIIDGEGPTRIHIDQ
jgi:hypothetical protein